jgi:hypothetical protein
MIGKVLRKALRDEEMARQADQTEAARPEG